MNNNSTTERSLKDVFSTTSYITIGEKDKSLNYVTPCVHNHWYLPGVKEANRSAFGGKAFSTNPVKLGTLPEVYLEKKYNWVSDGDKFSDAIGYSKLQPEKKKGFNSGDFRRKDEFTRNIRSEQHREALKSELASTKKDSERRAALPENADLPDIVMRTREQKSRPHLYDLLDRNDSGFPMKCPRDTKNPTITSNERNYGTWKTTSQLFGYGVEGQAHEKPEYARIPIVKKTFYRTQGVM
mmetsp:Transcript_18215/g.21862  ORF Transcript_18215/g.21862 Transcript_18215/m.21862 type:complete len:240 (-) Transcript_18215:92-811(-)|eukprot:CAMPEP_0197850538 /NCGR_PEP_ID=MMETSP1438-20131217/15656_1 /TAXON_ID=1461541 /ORGANISM="Pterosperma sp., Strain CCMP1384" /LENGTH=239 /DNA_ID=CAMNT_0043463747 /DNA_START=215 /DNA_END=934 /DNA_ORIENTATION=+